MEKLKIAGTNYWVSPIGLGTVKLGRNQHLKYPDEFEIPNDQEVSALLNTAHNLGINLIDTAPAYGMSEQRLGELLPGHRNDWHIMTKVGEEFRDGESHFDFTPEHIEMSVKRSLKRLKVDHLDTVLIHSDGRDVELIERIGVLEVLEHLKQKGFLCLSGMSTKTVEGGLLALAQSDVLMVAFNLEDDSQLAVLEAAEKQDKAVIIKKAFASGHFCTQDNIKQVFERIFSYPAVSSVIAGTINQAHLRQNVALSTEVLLQA